MDSKQSPGNSFTEFDDGTAMIVIPVLQRDILRDQKQSALAFAQDVATELQAVIDNTCATYTITAVGIESFATNPRTGHALVIKLQREKK